MNQIFRLLMLQKLKKLLDDYRYNYIQIKILQKMQSNNLEK